MVDWPGPSVIGPTNRLVASGASVLLAALARKLSVPPLSVMFADAAVRLPRLTDVVLALPLLSRASVAPGLTMKPGVVIAVPAATSASVPAWTTVLPVYVLADSRLRVPVPTLVRSADPLTMPGRLRVTPALTPMV